MTAGAVFGFAGLGPRLPKALLQVGSGAWDGAGAHFFHQSPVCLSRGASRSSVPRPRSVLHQKQRFCHRGEGLGSPPHTSTARPRKALQELLSPKASQKPSCAASHYRKSQISPKFFPCSRFAPPCCPRLVNVRYRNAAPWGKPGPLRSARACAAQWGPRLYLDHYPGSN